MKDKIMAAPRRKATMYKESFGWIVHRWSESYGMYGTFGPYSYQEARRIVGDENKGART